MDWREYYRKIFEQAMRDSMTALGWKLARASPLVVAFMVWLGTILIFAYFENDTAVLSQVSWYLSRALILIPVFAGLFLCYLVIAPYKVASVAEAKHHQTVTGLQQQIAGLSSQLNDRRQQQHKAREYSGLIHKGRKHLVKWISAIRTENTEEIQFYRDRSFKWLDNVKTKLEKDFGIDVAERFNFGKPEQLIIGLSEPEEHQARLAELVTMIQEMRSGELNLNLMPDDETGGPNLGG